MKHIVKTLGLLSIFAVIPGAMAATSRVSMVSKASPRLPSIAGYVKAVTSTTGTSSTSGTLLLEDVDCMNNYTDCITAEDACGADFEECTTNVLFHAQMPKCINVLYQCKTAGINSLFGTSNIGALSEVASSGGTNAEGEIIRYTYPTDGSVLGQRIIGGAIANKLTTEQCVRRYTNCLHRDEVCGSDFELCTTQKEFKKQAVLCASTLARCESDGKKQLFGSVANAESLKPSGEDARLVTMIEEGAQLAAMNAVKTCQRVTDNCLVGACVKNPWRCVEGTNMSVINAADFVGSSDGEQNTSTATLAKNGDSLTSDTDLYTLTGSDIRKLLKAQCLETIGANRYCHMTYREKSPNNKELMDVDLMEDVFSLAYAARKESVNTKIQEELKKFDTDAKDSCAKVITECAMRSCGGGIGSVCYSEAHDTNGVAINGDSTYNDIKSGCAAIVNVDPNCQYAATSNDDGGYTYGYKQDVFGTLFPKKSANSDPIGAVALLNSLLATSYNDAAIEQMKKQCQTVALSCVKSMCGKDYTNCYRNRTDVISGSYDTGAATFDKSMNKMGGVLDYNIVMGLCMNTVTTSSVCEEHLKIAASNLRKKSDTQSWFGTKTDKDGNTTTEQYNSVRTAWLDANTTTTPNKDMLVACKVGEANASDVCNENATMPPVDGKCLGLLDENGCMYGEPVYQVFSEYILENAGKTLFQELLRNVEQEAQAKYNAKLTKEQHMCLENNNGGIMGSSENGSTFMWVKLGTKKVPKDYPLTGLKTNQFKASNDLYGSFCRARITVMSDDKMIQEMLGDETTAYFAVGDAFTCGSWISSKKLKEIGEKVANKALCDAGYGQWDSAEQKCNEDKLSTKEKLAYAWGTVAPALGGGAIGTALTESGVIGGLINKSNEKNSNSSTQKQRKSFCISYANNAINASTEDAAKSALDKAISECKGLYATADQGRCEESPDTSGDDALKNIRTAAQNVKSTCEVASNTNAANAGKNNNLGARIAIPIVSTLGAGALGAGITASVLKANRESAKTEAEQKWMAEVGEHIQCYLGTDELGTYGDVVSIEIE